MESVPDKVLDLAARLRVILDTELGTFSNGAQALWIEGAPFPTALSGKGLQLILSDEYLVRRRHPMSGGQTAITACWQATLTQVGDTPENSAARTRAREKIQASFQRVSYRASAASSREFRQAFVKFEFDTVLNPIDCR